MRLVLILVFALTCIFVALVRFFNRGSSRIPDGDTENLDNIDYNKAFMEAMRGSSSSSTDTLKHIAAQQAQQRQRSQSWLQMLLPVYTVGIVIYFIYALRKVLGYRKDLIAINEHLSANAAVNNPVVNDSASTDLTDQTLPSNFVLGDVRAEESLETEKDKSRAEASEKTIESLQNELDKTREDMAQLMCAFNDLKKKISVGESSQVTSTLRQRHIVDGQVK